MRNEPFLVAAYRSTMEPFMIAIPEADLADLRARLRATRWPQPLAGPERGVTVDALQKLVAYWLDEFDWRAQERALNAFPSSRRRSTASGFTSSTRARSTRTRCR